MSTANLMKKSTPKTLQPWYLVTNHLNLLYMLAAGLVMEPSWFRGKHYFDSLGAVPGWVPLFRDAIPTRTFEEAISERRHLRPCLVCFDLSGVSGPVQVLSREGKVRDAKLPSIRLGKAGIGIFVRAPLPLTLISRICFQSDEDQQIFEAAAKYVSNVDLKPYRLAVEESLFRNATDSAWPPMQTAKARQNKLKNESGTQTSLPLASTPSVQRDVASQIEHRHISAQALGGLLSMLYHCANHSELGVKVYQLITDSSRNKSFPLIDDPILAELPNWLSGNGVSEHSSIPARLYWGTIDALVAAQEGNHSSQPVDVALEYLAAQAAQLEDDKSKSRLDRLIVDMRSLLGLGGGTITELFERHKGSLSRPLLLFCLREHCKDLLEFSHPLLSDAEHLLAGILFGVRDGWLRLPCDMRNQALSAYAMYRMACFAHQKQGGELILPETPSPQPLRALFPCDAESWHKSQINAAIEIAKVSKWRDCIDTVIASTDGSSLTEPKQESGSFVFSGETTSTMKVRHDVFLKHLGEWPPIDANLESKIRNDLNSAGKEEIGQI